MRIYFSNLARPKRVSKTLASIFVKASLSQAQGWCAQIYGYRDWRELRAVTESGEHPPSSDDEIIDAGTREARARYQAMQLQACTQCPPERALAIIQYLAPTSSKPGAPLREGADIPAPASGAFYAPGANRDPRTDAMAQIVADAESGRMSRRMASMELDRLAEKFPDIRAAREQDRAEREALLPPFLPATPGAAAFFAALEAEDWGAAIPLLRNDMTLARAISPRGFTPAMVVIQRDNADMLDVLGGGGGADFNQLDAEGFAPLHEAARRGAAACVRTLLRHGANPNLQTPDGWSALLLVVSPSLTRKPEQSSDIALALMTSGANPHLANKAGVSASALAGTAAINDEARAAVRRSVGAAPSEPPHGRRSLPPDSDCFLNRFARYHAELTEIIDDAGELTTGGRLTHALADRLRQHVLDPILRDAQTRPSHERALLQMSAMIRMIEMTHFVRLCGGTALAHNLTGRVLEPPKRPTALRELLTSKWPPVIYTQWGPVGPEMQGGTVDGAFWCHDHGEIALGLTTKPNKSEGYVGRAFTLQFDGAALELPLPEAIASASANARALCIDGKRREGTREGETNAILRELQLSDVERTREAFLRSQSLIEATLPWLLDAEQGWRYGADPECDMVTIGAFFTERDAHRRYELALTAIKAGTAFAAIPSGGDVHIETRAVDM